MAEAAFEHGVKGNDVELVIEIGERYISAKLLGGEVKVVQGWLDILPAKWYEEYPKLGLFRASILLVTGQFDVCMHCLDTVESQVHAEDDNRQTLARVTALRCYITNGAS